MTPVPKIPHPQSLNDLRKISLTSEFSLVYEGFIKDWLLEDLGPIIDKSQFGNQKGQSTEHLLVCLMDQIHKLLDSNPNNSAIIASLIDWASAFDRQDATQTIARLIKMNVRSWLIPIIADYLTGRSCTVRFNGENSSEHELPGAGSQGTILGMLLYQANTNENTNVQPLKLIGSS